MSRVLALFLFVTFSSAVVQAQSSGQQVQAPAAQPVTAQGAAVGEPSDDTAGTAQLGPGGQADLLDGIIEDYDYVPEGKRDPFKPWIEDENKSGVQIAGPAAQPILPLERYSIEELKLVGIIWSTRDPKAMFVDPDSRTYIAKVNDRIGQNRGYIAAIREGEVVIVEPYGREGFISYQTRVITLERP